MIRLCLIISDVIHTNEHTQYANCSLLVNVWIFRLMPFCFMTKKYHLKQKLSPLKNKNRSPLKILQNSQESTYFVEHLRTDASAKNLSNLSVFIAA